MKEKQEFSTKNLNDELMPIANDIKAKMEALQKKYNIKLDEFAFPEIKIDEIINPSEK